jgi:hypothetical protein
MTWRGMARRAARKGPAPGNGGKLAGNSFNGTPRMNNGDVLQVVVRWGSSNPPAQLTGHFIFSPAESAPNQTTPSPFVNSSKYVCYARQIVQKDANSPSYTFAGITYGGSQPGNYELTFVAEDSSTTPATQWSEDPEFDTGN